MASALPEFQVVNAAMPERSPGEPVWLEVPCVNPDRAMAFYNAVFGWEASKSMPTPLPTFVEGVDALYPFEKGKLRGGFSKMANGASDIASAGSGWAKHGPVMELFVKDIDETTAKVVAAGGTVHASKTPLYGGGAWGHLARYIDTEGNLVGVWSEPTA